jgi:hypothetical protein
VAAEIKETIVHHAAPDFDFFRTLVFSVPPLYVGRCHQQIHDSHSGALTHAHLVSDKNSIGLKCMPTVGVKLYPALADELRNAQAEVPEAAYLSFPASVYVSWMAKVDLCCQRHCEIPLARDHFVMTSFTADLGR